jgi:hypothetical protein
LRVSQRFVRLVEPPLNLLDVVGGAVVEPEIAQLGEYVSTIAEGRLSEGFELEELQRALRILEVKAWRLVANESGVDSLRANLTALNTTIGYARDELARVSQAHAYADCSGSGSSHLGMD